MCVLDVPRAALVLASILANPIASRQATPPSATAAAAIVLVDAGDLGGRGTGFLYADPSHVVTTFHGVQGVERLSVFSPTLQATRQGRIERVIPETDLALLVLDRPFDAAPLDAVDRGHDITPGESYRCWGNQLGEGRLPEVNLRISLAPDLLGKIVTREARTEFAKSGYPDLRTLAILLDGNLNPGFSGAPLYTPDGRVVGIVTGGVGGGQMGIGWAVLANPYLDDLLGSEDPTGPKPRKVGFSFWTSAPPKGSDASTAESTPEQVERWRSILRRRYANYFGKGINDATIERLVRECAGADPAGIEKILEDYSSELVWDGRYLDGPEDYRELLGMLASASANLGEPGSASPGKPSKPREPADFTIRLYHDADSAGGNRKLETVCGRLREEKFRVEAIEPLDLKDKDRRGRYVGDLCLADLKIKRDRRVCYPSEAESVLEILRQYFPEKSHAYITRPLSSKQYEAEGGRSDLSRIIDIVGLP